MEFKLSDSKLIEIFDTDHEKFQNELDFSYRQNTMNIILAGKKCIEAYKSGKKVLIAGNGGSAADAQHISAELTGFFDDRDRKALEAIALHCDTSALTAISNDKSYEMVFSRLIEAHGKSGDIFIAITTSGNSPNVLRGIEKARELGLYTIALLGGDGGKAKNLADLSLIAGSSYTPSIQAIHSRFYHPICKIIDLEFADYLSDGIDKIVSR